MNNQYNTPETVSANELKLATAYLTSGMLITDSLSTAISMIKDGASVCSKPCSGWCQESSDTTWVMRHVGNDVERARRMQLENLEKGLSCACLGCSEKHFTIADVLDHHLSMLRCVKSGDHRGATRAAGRRGELLKKLGYKLA